MNGEPLSPFDKALKEALRPEAPSPEFKARLLALARKADQPVRWLRPLLLTAAASLLLGVGASLVLGRSGGPGITPDTALASAVKLHDVPQEVCFKERDCGGKGCGEWAQVRAGFRAPLPACVQETELVAGAACTLAGRPAVRYHLRDGSLVYVLSRPLDDCPLQGRSRMKQGPLQGEAWNEEGRGYLRVALNTSPAARIP